MKKSSVFNGIGSRKNVRMSLSRFKTLLVCFFDQKKIVHYKFIAQGQTVNQQC
jgi:hypothetical protein